MKRNRLYEYITFDKPYEAGGDDQNNAPAGNGAQGDMPPTGAPDQQGDNMPPTGGPDQQGGDMPPTGGPDQQGGDMPPTGAPDQQGGNMPPMGGPDQQGGDMDVAGGFDIPDANFDDEDVEDVDMDGIGPDDQVIDVDDLTQSQEAAEYKIDGVDEKLTTLGAVVSKFIEALKQNDSKIEDLKAEFEKRVPTEEERLNLRSMSSVPYMQTPGEYWSNKVSQNPRYNIMNDNTIAPKDEQEEFELRKSDLNGLDDRTIANSFDYPTSLKDILDF